MYYLEDLSDGLEFKLGSTIITKEAMIDFAEKYDPQAFHVDEEVGKKMFGGLIASGWQTASLCHRLVVDRFLKQTACMASPGVDEMKFIRPVFINDELTGSLTVISTRQSKSKPDRGVAKLKAILVNAKQEPVLSYIGTVMVSCKSASK